VLINNDLEKEKKIRKKGEERETGNNIFTISLV
jgi:hypothetical protein